MSYLLDTDVLWELTGKRPDGSVLAWARSVPDSSRYLSVLTIGELRRGVEYYAPSMEKERLRLWLEHDCVHYFDQHILPVDVWVVQRWGQINATVEYRISAIDGLLAATALHHGLTLVTRKPQDFPIPGLLLLNPWKLEA